LIKIPKKQLYNPHFFNTLLRKHTPLKIVLHAALFSFFYLVLPIYCISRIAFKFKDILIFYFLNISIVYFIIKKLSKENSQITLEIQEFQEKINTKTDEIEKERKIGKALESKISRYKSLKDIIQQINNTFDLASIANYLVNVAFTQIGRDKGACLLYLVDAPNQSLNLYSVKKEDSDLIIKAKQGDIFDNWVLRHASTLFIEDIKKDFRFDVDKIDAEHRRNLNSLISSPLISQEKMLGIIRLDNSTAQFFTQDDLRLLNTISDLGAVALENFELFQKTQELAIKDGLTSLYRKDYFLERLKDEFKRSARQKKELSLLMIDIDYFKDYNDRFGHTAGDIVLREIALALKAFFETAILCRFGGEEFCVLLPDTKKKNASMLAEKFRERIKNKEVILRRHKTNITVSIGLAAYPLDASVDEELLYKSDLALYEAKHTGRNKVCSA
jgi:diguanylate cyclase (GGDEF)-like protein